MLLSLVYVTRCLLQAMALRRLNPWGRPARPCVATIGLLSSRNERHSSRIPVLGITLWRIRFLTRLPNGSLHMTRAKRMSIRVGCLAAVFILMPHARRTQRDHVRAMRLVRKGQLLGCVISSDSCKRRARSGDRLGDYARQSRTLFTWRVAPFERHVDVLREMVQREGNRHQSCSRSYFSMAWHAPEVESVRLSVLFSDFSSRRRRKHCKNQSNAATGGPTT